MKTVTGGKLNLDWKIAVLTIVSTTLILIDFYYSPILPWSKFFPGWAATGIPIKVFDRTLLYFAIPLIFIVLVFHQKPSEFGFGIGDWKAGITLTIAGMLMIAPVLWIVGHYNAGMQDYYKGSVGGLPWNTLLDLFGWEFMFRGWLLFGYARKFGPEAIWLQAVPFALAHIGKPDLETLSTIFGGFAFGWVAWRSKSFIYPLLIHWFLATFMILIAAGLLG